MERITLIANPGMIFTNGRVTGHKVMLAEGENPSAYRQITEEEYYAAMAEEESEEETNGN